MATFTDNQLEFLAVNAMGRASEAGSLAIMQLGLATDIHKDGTVYYTTNFNNSGYTVGFFQWDFGAKGKYSAHKLIDEYNNWAKNTGEPLINDINNAVQLITRHGHIYLLDGKGKRVINQNPLEGQQNLLNQPLGKQLNKFIASDGGYKFVMSLQEKQYKDSLKSIMKKVAETPAIKNMPQDDANMVLAAYAKAVNQSGFVYHMKDNNGKKHKFIRPLPIMQEKNIDKNVIIDILKKEHTPDVAKSIEATKKGVNLYNALSDDKTFLNSIFIKQMELDPTLSKFDFKTNPEEQMLDAMFRNPDAAQKLIHAYNNGSAYQIDNHNGAIKDEAYTIGVTKEGQIYSVDKTGKGFYIEHDSKEWHKLNNLQDLGVSFTHHQHSNHNNKQQASPVAALPDNLSKQLAELKDFAYPNPGINKQYNTAQIDNICASALNKLCARGNQNQELLDIAITQDYKEITVYYNNRLGNENSISLDANMAASIPHDQTVAQLEKTINQHLTEQQNLEQQRNQSHGPRTV